MIHYGKLTPAKIAKINKDGDYGDGGGLSLQVRNDCRAKSWLFRWKDQQTGKDRNMGLGSLRTVDLDEARAEALKNRKLLRDGKDPKVERDGAKLDQAHKLGLAKTVNEVIDEFFDTKVRHRTENTKQQATWVVKIARDTIGTLPIQKIDTKMIMDVVGLQKMWLEKYPTANRLLSYLRRIFSLAITKGYYIGQNPARWKDHLENSLRGRDAHKTKHHRSLPYQEVGRFMETLRAYEDRSCNHTGHLTITLLLEFIILTGCRSSEARRATWNHIDRQNMIWTVPKENHKVGERTGEPILRPISKPMLTVLDEMAKRHPNHTPEAVIFPSPRSRSVPTPFTIATLIIFVRKSLECKATAHGFRSTFTDWCRANGYSEALYDAQLGHVVGDDTARAYARNQLVDQRRPMMDRWAKYCSQPAPEPIGGTNIEDFDERKRKTAS